LITAAQIEAVIGPIQRPSENMNEAGPIRSPGTLSRHYAPRTPLELAADDGRARIDELRRQGKRVGWLTLEPAFMPNEEDVVALQLPCEPVTYGAGLYAALHALDDAGVDRIVVAAPPATDAWLAIHDRLRRAAMS
jgi:L-threonylcarbamoyladenylate synthase